MSYSTIRATISGRISAASVKVGNFVRSADLLPIATIIQTAPIYVTFPVPQGTLPDIRKALAAETATIEANVPGETRGAGGAVTMIENTVDPGTGMVQVRATMPNTDEFLWPGTLVTTKLKLRDEEAVTVPSAAVQVSQAGSFVFVVKDNKVAIRLVKIARVVGDETALASGVEDGETVVTDGFLQLTDGARVNIRQSRARSLSMGISEACIRRPVMTTLETVALIVFGIFGYRLLSVAALPAVDFPTIQITATLPGASPETMAASVAGPIERQMSTIAGITSMKSTSALGTTTIIIQFDLNRNIDGAALDVQTALTVAQRRLPVEMTTPPFFRKVNPGDFPILFISLISSTLPLSKVDDYAQLILGQQISQLPGVAQVLVFGSQKFAIRVQVDPVAAAQRNISLDDIRNVIAKANSNTPVGTLVGREQNVTLTASAAMMHAEDYRKIVVAYRNGAPVRLEEIARVVDGVENDKVASLYNDERAIVLAIQRQPDANTVAVVDAVRGRLPAFRSQVPASVKMEVLNDRSISIRDSVVDVQETLAIAISLVVLVIFMFLRTVSATIIPALAVPVSLVATCGVIYFLGFSINNMTLLALTLSVGFVVDDAIVMLENIVRHIEGGMRPYEAALKGAREIGFTIVSITFSLIAVFIPILLMGGMVGRVFREFAVTIAITIVMSAFVSLTLTPMLCARVLRSHHEGDGQKQNIVLRAFEAMFEKMRVGYETSLDWVLDHKSTMLIATVATLLASAALYVVIPKGFFPVEDTGFINATVEGPADISFKAMYDRQREIANIVQKDKSVDYVNSTVGTGGPNATNNYGRLFIALKPKKERGESVTEVIQRLRRTANSTTGMITYFQAIQNINITGRSSKSEFQYTLQSSDTEQLYRLAPELRDKISGINGLRDVTSDLYIKNPQRHDRHRSRKGCGLWRLGRSDTSGIVQRVRQPSGRYHLYGVERLSDHSRKPAGNSG